MRFEDFTDFELNVKGVSVRGLKGGDGSPLLLLHGSAHSPRIWQAVAGRLAERHAVVVAAIDFDILRAPHPSRAGQGANAPRHAYNEDPRAGHSDGAAAAVARHTRCGHREIAAEQLAVMEALGHAQFMVCGHLDGARVAQRLALDHSGCVDRMMVLDTAPTLPLDPASVPDPDDAVGDPNGWVPSRVVDAEHADRELVRGNLERGEKIACPVRVLWGAQGAWTVSPLDSWRKVARDTSGRALECAPSVPEHAPDTLLDEMSKFFDTRAC
ncbi:MAG TPA: alpha/beta hydrolase [Pararobbsia sp.]|jgi:haloacetate dehalogenase|nr:alpha/beta hydrolase [Pararobbsia sp.]